MILSFSSLVWIFHFFSYLFIRSIYLFTFSFTIDFDLVGVVMTWVMSSTKIVSRQPGPGDGKSLEYREYSVGESTLPCGTSLFKLISLLFFLCRREAAMGNKNKTKQPTVVSVPGKSRFSSQKNGISVLMIVRSEEQLA